MSDVPYNPRLEAGDVVMVRTIEAYHSNNLAGCMGLVVHTRHNGAAVVRLEGYEYVITFTTERLTKVTNEREKATFHARLALGIEP